MVNDGEGTVQAATIAGTRWRIDPDRSRIEFQVPHFYGLITVKGHFETYEGFLALGSRPAIELTIDAASLDTGNKKRDVHLRSEDFFDVPAHPRVRFVADSGSLDGQRLRVAGRLEAAGASVPLALDATLHGLDGELEVLASTTVDHRQLGMTWSPLGMVRTPSKLTVTGRLVPDG